jgi:hypothetical protein
MRLRLTTDESGDGQNPSLSMASRRTMGLRMAAVSAGFCRTAIVDGVGGGPRRPGQPPP